MKKTLVSLATASLIVTGAIAADVEKKGIDLVTTGQAVIYYETNTDKTEDGSVFSRDNSQANVGVQLNVGADLGNNFTFGSQISYIGTAGLEKNLVIGTKQTAGDLYDTTNELALSKIFVAKTIGKTGVKIGRQELPKSLSPFAFSEGWNVFKNTFDAILATNSDLPDTLIAAAYVSKSNSTIGTGLGQMNDLTVAKGIAVENGAYMLTVQNKSLPLTTITASYYGMDSVVISGTPQTFENNTTTGASQIDQNATAATSLNNASAAWLDVTVAGKDMPMGLIVGLQGGMIMTDHTALKDTTAYGVKLGLKPLDALYLQVAYSAVDDGSVAIKNVGTGVKTPLYTQMIYNQNAIASDANTIVAKAVYNTGDFGKVIAQYGMTTDESATANDYSELDLMYKINAGGVQYFAAYIMANSDRAGKIIGSKTDTDNKVRVWARLNF